MKFNYSFINRFNDDEKQYFILPGVSVGTFVFNEYSNALDIFNPPISSTRYYYIHVEFLCFAFDVTVTKD